MAKSAQIHSKGKPNPRFNDSAVQPFNAPPAEICILAGGFSKRMGRDKSRLRIGPTTMLGTIRKAARATGLPVRVIRRDIVIKCGPLGGVYTALKTTRAEIVLFLACDMPLVSAEFIEFLLRQLAAPFRKRKILCDALFVRSRGRVGFPFVLPRKSLETVFHQIENSDLSLQSLAAALQAIVLKLKQPWSRQLLNVNTRKDWVSLRARLLHADFSR
jgi:molybdopterin-guanine dinucleotide biosynthesis protein A